MMQLIKQLKARFFRKDGALMVLFPFEYDPLMYKLIAICTKPIGCNSAKILASEAAPQIPSSLWSITLGFVIIFVRSFTKSDFETPPSLPSP